MCPESADQRNREIETDECSPEKFEEPHPTGGPHPRGVSTGVRISEYHPNLHGFIRAAAHKPLITKSNRAARLMGCKAHRN
ncbi:hypothetical protein CEXT_112561 [Caerostris extrusa]|uniref:Uncharacterized protein n=1 Tax=Caerostris extrusa TaxID=172846 RepID=A0AAV4WUL5_CAEEX|nr:hypothetical protein CEXT_112561 [Caerostris extrusa]